MTTPPKLIVALDTDNWKEAKALVDTLSEAVDIFKVGSHLFTSEGPDVVRYILNKKKKVFLDLKFHDIPNTVAGAVRSAVGLTDKSGKQSIFMCTLHTQGGVEMMKRAAQEAMKQAQTIGVKRPLLVGITVLTSEVKKDNIQDLVMKRALLAQEAGLDGVVASSHETISLRQKLGDNFVIVTPGIRPEGSEAGDQKRIMTPREAVDAGSNFLVVGRPIIKAPDPLAAAKRIVGEIESK